MRNKTRIYIDTSVIGGYYDKEFAVDTRLFFKRIERGDFIIHLSEVSYCELENAPHRVKRLIKLIRESCYFGIIN